MYQCETAAMFLPPDGAASYVRLALRQELEACAWGLLARLAGSTCDGKSESHEIPLDTPAARV